MPGVVEWMNSAVAYLPSRPARLKQPETLKEGLVMCAHSKDNIHIYINVYVYVYLQMCDPNALGSPSGINGYIYSINQ